MTYSEHGNWCACRFRRKLPCAHSGPWIVRGWSRRLPRCALAWCLRMEVCQPSAFNGQFDLVAVELVRNDAESPAARASMDRSRDFMPKSTTATAARCGVPRFAALRQARLSKPTRQICGGATCEGADEMEACLTRRFGLELHRERSGNVRRAPSALSAGVRPGVRGDAPMACVGGDVGGIGETPAPQIEDNSILYCCRRSCG